MKTTKQNESPRIIPAKQLAVLMLIAAERSRQERLKNEGRFRHSCDSTDISSLFKLATLAEEFGEVAREVYEMHEKSDFTPQRRAALNKELVQVAAVCVAWLETPDAEATKGTEATKGLPA